MSVPKSVSAMLTAFPPKQDSEAEIKKHVKMAEGVGATAKVYYHSTKGRVRAVVVGSSYFKAEIIPYEDKLGRKVYVYATRPFAGGEMVKKGIYMSISLPKSALGNVKGEKAKPASKGPKSNRTSMKYDDKPSSTKPVGAAGKVTLADVRAAWDVEEGSAAMRKAATLAALYDNDKGKGYAGYNALKSAIEADGYMTKTEKTKIIRGIRGVYEKTAKRKVPGRPLKG
jgi:hypothetical protein